MCPMSEPITIIVKPAEHPFGVFYRPTGGRWALAGTGQTENLASSLMYDLMGTERSGDWTVTRRDNPPTGKAIRHRG